MENKLANAKSPYLKSASKQPVNWYPWGKEAFERAQRENKPVLLSIGAIWCHWCHVMAKESFENKEIAQIINEYFIPIKVDRDERPDIDKRYQEAVVAITGEAGWPLTVFLTPEGNPFYGGTYFPPEDKWGKPGFKRLLKQIIELWQKEKEKLYHSASLVYELFKSSSLSSFEGTLEESILDRGIKAIFNSLDPKNGGFSGAPKFYHPKAWEFLLYHYYFTQDPSLKSVLEKTLDSMAKGGVYDHLLGGFFRYSTDPYFRIPHFEKMLYDNAELLHLYSLAYAILEKDLYKYVVEGIRNYYQKWGMEKEGGFYASQDADIGYLEEGGYYTFTQEELKKILSEEERKAISYYYGLESPYGLPHDLSKKVPYLAHSEESVAFLLKKPLEEVQRLIQSAKSKMLNYRESQRETPFIDKTFYTNWNGLMISALCTYYKIFKDPWAKDSAQKTVEKILKENYKNGVLFHSSEVEGFSEDYLFFSKGLLEVFEITQEKSYLDLAKNFTDKAIDLFWDREKGGFFDEVPSEKEGFLDLKRKSLSDSSYPSVNGLAPYFLLLLAEITEEERYFSKAQKVLEIFANLIKDYPLVSFSYFISLYTYLKGILKIETFEYFEKILHLFRPLKIVVKKDLKGIQICFRGSCRLEAYLSEDLIQSLKRLN
ncbi:MAG: thioredoxin domain-containing protein [Thermodesulfobacteriaceae bacterium]|nr:thioredoxin domain-containing protein [Thermodesulfobacteriaceae bacterium]MCX8041847.1 thioredoxin domain-containing protein [Thermodesulfobacteriaceae bacterium]MDW8136785.1 thioredoxin domain-containing protein [Thermodesulfobacterium sp.]